MGKQDKVRKRKTELRKAEKTKKSRSPVDNVQVPSHSSGFLSKCFFLIFLVSAGLIAIAITGYSISPVKALSTTDYSEHLDFVGVFESNRKLSKGIKIFGLNGPEAVEEDVDGNLYTGLVDGRVVRISPSTDGEIGQGQITNITTGVIEKFTHVKHGRPLGLRLVRNTLYVADAFYGIYSINLKTNVVTSLVAPDDVTPRLGLADDLYVTKDGQFLYFSDVSSKYGYHDIVPLTLEGLCDGRVFQYNIRTNEIRTVVSGLCFANGVQMSFDESHLYVCETLRYRVNTYDAKTWELKKQTAVPMAPDNIRPTDAGTYWIAGALPRDQLTGVLERSPWIRQILAGLFSPETIFKNAFYGYNMMVEMSEDGEILQSLHDPDGELARGLSHASPLGDGRVVLGTFYGNYLSILDDKNPAIGNL